MTFPSPANSGFANGSSNRWPDDSCSLSSQTLSSHAAAMHGSAASIPAGVASAVRCSGNGFPTISGDGEHQLEKLEFALAVALTRGDWQRSQQLRDQIAALGGNLEEPGT